MSHKNLPICLIIAVIFVVLVSFSLWPYMWEDEFLSRWSSVVAMVSLIGAPIAYFVRQHEKEEERKAAEAMEQKRASRNLCKELEDTLDAIRGDKFPQDMYDVKLDNTKITFTNVTHRLSEVF